MRSLSPAEIRVIRVLLADPPISDRIRERIAGVPKTTYETIRRRAFTSGWLEERYIPTPSAVGALGATFILAQPYAEYWEDVIQAFRDNRDVVLLWASPETIFSVSFNRGTPDLANFLVPPKLVHRLWKIVAKPGAGDVPAYFDYEGAWSWGILNTPPLSYPRSFANRTGGEAECRSSGVSSAVV